MIRTYTLQQLHYRIMREHNTEFLSLASTPNDEICTQAGHNLEDQKIECRALINLLRRTYGKEPQGSEFVIIENFHEFGIYYEAGIVYEYTPEPEEMNFDTDEEFYNYSDQMQDTQAQIYAFKCEHIPDNWDNEGKAELMSAGHSAYQPAKVIKMKFA